MIYPRNAIIERSGLRSVVVDCNIIGSDFKSPCYVCFRNNPLGKSISPEMPSDMGYIVSLLYIYKDGLDIK